MFCLENWVPLLKTVRGRGLCLSDASRFARSSVFTRRPPYGHFRRFSPIALSRPLSIWGYVASNCAVKRTGYYWDIFKYPSSWARGTPWCKNWVPLPEGLLSWIAFSKKKSPQFHGLARQFPAFSCLSFSKWERGQIDNANASQSVFINLS